VNPTIAQHQSSTQAPIGFAPTPTEFLRHWFDGTPTDQFLELRALPIGIRKRFQEFFTLDAVPDLVGRAFSLVEDFDCYFSVCPRVRPRGDAASVTHAPGFWCDLDFKRFQDGEAGALRALAEFSLRPTWIIGTGGGFHVYWKLRAPVHADTAFECRVKSLAKMLGADLAATDLARVLRVPGTWNHKRDFQVKVLSWPTLS